MFVFSKRSKNNLMGVHPKLVEVMTKALEYTEYDFVVTEGTRTLEQQKRYLAEGKSKTLKSYHLIRADGYGYAVDVAALVPNGKGKSEVSWDLKYYAKINEAVQKAASELGAKVTWGGSWKSFVDSPHFQLEM